MDNIRLTIEIPAELATALAGFIESMKVVAVERGNNNTAVVGGVVAGNVEEVCVPETAEEVIEFCQDNNLVVNGRRFFNYYKDRNWHDTNGKAVTNWKERILMWDETDRKKNPAKLPQMPRPTGKDDTDRLTRILNVEDQNK